MCVCVFVRVCEREREREHMPYQRMALKVDVLYNRKIKYIVCGRVRASFSPEIVQGVAVKGLKLHNDGEKKRRRKKGVKVKPTHLYSLRVCQHK